MITYRDAYGALVDAEFIEGECLVCGVPRLQCAADRGQPFIKIEEEES